MPNVQMPNGDIVGFPDDMPPDQIKGMIATKFPSVEQSTMSDVKKSAISTLEKAPGYLATSTPGSIAGDIYNQTVVPIAQGAGRLAGAAYTGLGGDLSPEAAEKFTNPLPEYKTPDDIQKLRNAASQAIGQQTGVSPQYQPITGAGRATQTALNAAPYIAADGGEGALDTLLKSAGVGAGSEIGRSVAQSAGAGQQGQQAASVIGGALGYGAPSAIENGIPSITKAVSESNPLDLLKNTATGTPDTLPTSKMPTYPGSSDTQKALFQAHTDALTHDKDLYDWRDQMAQGKVVQDPSLKDTMTSLIDDAKSKVANPQVESSAITKLNKINAKINSDGTVPLDALTDLDRYFNSLPSRAYTDSPINGQARGIVKNSIEKAAQTFPEFGDAHYAANDFHTNLKNEWENSVLDPIYNPDDTKNLDLFYRGKTRTPNPETQARGENLMENINNQGVTAFNQVKNLLPDEASQNAFTKEFLDYVKNKDGNGRMNAMKNLITDPFNNTGRKIFDIVRPQYNADTKGIINAQNGKMPYDYGNDNTPFSSYMADSKAALQEQRDFQKSGGYSFSPTGQKVLPAPNTPLALPSPHRPFVNDSASRQLRPMTDDELAIHNMSPSDQAKRMQKVPQSIKPDELQQIKNARDAVNDWNSKYQTLLDNGKTHLEAVRQLGNPPEAPKMPQDWGTGYGDTIRRMQSMSDWDKNAKALQDAGDTPKEVLNKLGKRPEAPTFKKGGRVNTNPSEAQIAAGNYAKGHIKLHGLDITIENPKGSIRRGVDKSGKKWQNKSPADYGYIKKSVSGDGEHVDCYIGNSPKSKKIWVLDQKHLDSGKWDEHKVFLNFDNKSVVLATYRKAFSDGKADQRIQNISECSIDELKHWLEQTRKDAA